VVGAFEALLEEVTMFRESEKLMADPAVAQGDRTIAVGMAGRYDGLHFDNKWADRVHQTGAKVQSVAAGLARFCARVSKQLWWRLTTCRGSDDPLGAELSCSDPGMVRKGNRDAVATLSASVPVERVPQRV